MEFDIIIIGAGHNGLAAGCYLAKSGMKVIVLENRHIIGGGCVTEEVTLPGFKHNTHALIMAQIHSTGIAGELELEKYGLKFLNNKEDAIMLNPLDNGGAYIKYKNVNKTIKEIEKKFSTKDANAYRKFCEHGQKLFSIGIGDKAPPTSDDELYDKLIKLGPEGEDIYWYKRTNMFNLLNEFFEDDELKGILCWEGGLKGTDPYLYGCANYCFIPSVMHKVGFSIAEGGSISVVNAMQKCLENYNGIVRTNAGVEKIIIKNNRISGIKTKDGKEITAKRGILSNVNIKALIDHQILDKEHLEKRIIKQIKRIRAGVAGAVNWSIALNEPPKFTCHNGELPFHQQKGFSSLEDAERVWHGIRIGKPVEEKIPFYGAIPTLLDPTQAPKNKHTFWFNTITSNVLTNGDNWIDYKEKYYEIMLEELQNMAPNMTKKNILAVSLESPYEMGIKNPNFLEGNFAIMELTPDQTDIMRPTLSLSGYKTPITGLYLTGGGTYPAGGVTGVPGHNAAQVILDDLKNNLI